jgi:IPT/TIG domain
MTTSWKHTVPGLVTSALLVSVATPAFAGQCDGSVPIAQLPLARWEFGDPQNHDIVRVVWQYTGPCHDVFHMIVVANGQAGPQNEYSGDAWPCVFKPAGEGGGFFNCGSQPFLTDPSVAYQFQVQGCQNSALGSSCTGWGVAQKAPVPKPPSITSIFPNGDVPAGGSSIRIEGANFDTTGLTKVSFGPTPSPRVTCRISTECFAQSPMGNGIVSITVTVNGLSATAPAFFYYAPTVLGVNPRGGSWLDTVTIHGVGLGRATGIDFGPFPAQFFSCDADTDCTATVPPGGGSVDVRVHGANGGTSNVVPSSDEFSYGLPTITAINPNHGPISGGTLVQITGSGFDPSGQMEVDFGKTKGTVQSGSGVEYWVYSPQVGDVRTVDITASPFGVTSAATPMDRFKYDAKAILARMDVFGTWVTASLNGNAPPGGAALTFSSSDPSVVPPPQNVSIPAATPSTRFQIEELQTARNETVTLTASYLGSSVSTPIAVVATPPVMLGLEADSISKGMSTTGMVVIYPPAPAQGAVITLSSSLGGVTLPGQVTIAAGTRNATFTVTNDYSGPGPKDAVLTASYDGASATASLRLGLPQHPPPVCKGKTCQ